MGSYFFVLASSRVTSGVMYRTSQKKPLQGEARPLRCVGVLFALSGLIFPIMENNYQENMGNRETIALPHSSRPAAGWSSSRPVKCQRHKSCQNNHLKLAVLFSVPFNRNFYKNLFSIGLFKSTIKRDHDNYLLMYYGHDSRFVHDMGQGCS